MKIETIQKFDHRIRILNRMKDDYLFMRERFLEFQKNAPKGIELSVSVDYCDDCISLLDTMIKFYSRKINRS